ATVPEDPIERLRALLRSAFEHFEEHRAFVSLLVQEGAGECATVLAGRPSTTFRTLQARAFDVLERARENGTLRDHDTGYLAQTLMGALRSSVLHGLETGTAPAPAAAADRLLALFLSGASSR